MAKQPGEGEGLVELLDRVVGGGAAGGGSGRRLWWLGPYYRRVESLLGDRLQAASIVFTAAWAFCSPTVETLLPALQNDLPLPSRRARQLVVAHGASADGYPERYDLLILDSRHAGEPAVWRTTIGRILDRLGRAAPSRYFSRGGNSGTPVYGSRVVSATARALAAAGHPIDTALLQAAVNEMLSVDVAVVLAHEPEIVLTGAPRGAVGVDDLAGRPLGTVGVIAESGAGQTVATVAYHVVAAEPAGCLVDGFATAPLVYDRTTDSAALPVPDIEWERPRHGRRGPRPTYPALYSRHRFAGATSGPMEIQVTGADPGILADLPDRMHWVYTENAIGPGDSGAALVDSEDYVVGFAYGHSPLRAELSCAVWVWAAQVFDALGLRSEHTTLT